MIELKAKICYIIPTSTFLLKLVSNYELFIQLYYALYIFVIIHKCRSLRKYPLWIQKNQLVVSCIKINQDRQLKTSLMNQDKELNMNVIQTKNANIYFLTIFKYIFLSRRLWQLRHLCKTVCKNVLNALE